MTGKLDVPQVVRHLICQALPPNFFLGAECVELFVNAVSLAVRRPQSSSADAAMRQNANVLFVQANARKNHRWKNTRCGSVKMTQIFLHAPCFLERVVIARKQLWRCISLLVESLQMQLPNSGRVHRCENRQNSYLSETKLGFESPLKVDNLERSREIS